MPNPDAYTIGWICAVGTELVAAAAFLDEKHDDPEHLPVNDNNTYTLGRIGKHNVVIAALPHSQYGLVSAATAARDLVRSFSNVRIGLMVGIGGGAPSSKHDVRLGDIVVSSPGYGTGGVLQYDYGKTVQNAKFAMTGHLNQPPQFMLTAMSVLKAQYESDGHTIGEEIDRVLAKKPRLRTKYRRPDPSSDRLYISSFEHAEGDDADCAVVCEDTSNLINRAGRTEEEDNPMIHFGLIASANQLMKNATIRDKLAAEKDVLCFEMEAAGLVNHFPCLVIRGICDYSDTHKNKRWQGYAAMAAVAYAKDLLHKVAPNRVEAERRLAEVFTDVNFQLGDIQTRTNETHAEIKSIRTDKHFDDILKWLTPPNVSTNFNKAIKARHKGSGQRLLESESYLTWKNGQNSFLWLYGIPGCGKTILASTVIEDLQNNRNPSQTFYFYFDFTDSRKQSFENTLHSLVSQIYHRNENAQKHLDSLYSSCRNGKDQPSIDFLYKIFTSMIRELGEAWIVLDALDECTLRSELLSWMRDLAQKSHPETIVHLLVTSRPEQDIKAAIERHANNEQMIAIRSDLLEADIQNYVSARVREHDGLRRWQGRPCIQDKIEASLVEKANGMFRWVSCQLDALEKCLERKALLKALNDLPKTLDTTYERILANIPPEYRDHTIRILQFLTYSERPLRLDEAIDAIAVDVGEDVGSRFDPRDRLPVPQEIAQYCSSLVVLVCREGRYDEERIVEEIQLAHFSVKDYLTSSRLERETAQYLEQRRARASIAEVCLSYLLELKPEADVKKLFPFSCYSAQYWMNHAIAGDNNRQEVFALTMQLLTSVNRVRSWCRLHDPDRPWNNMPKNTLENSKIAPGLYYASLGGLSNCVRLMVAARADINAQGGQCGNALQAASYRGHKEVVHILIEADANVNAQGGYFGNALQAASCRGHKDVVQILLDANADVNAQGGGYGNALQAASYGGHKDILQMLLDANANVNAQSSVYSNALQAASYRGHEDVVRMLLDANADVNAQGGLYSNALQAALNSGRIEVVKLLLKKGADVSVMDNYGWSPLHDASSKGYFEVVRLFLEKGADVSVTDEDGWSPLHGASLNGHLEVVKLLLENEADVIVQNEDGDTALHNACSNGHTDVVKLLLEKGADVSVTDKDGWSPLHDASSRGHFEVVKLLLEKSADVAMADHHGWAPLHPAAKNGHGEVVRLLCQSPSVNVSQQDNNGRTPLFFASMRGQFDVTQFLLLTSPIDIHTKDRYNATPLFVASRHGHEMVASALLSIDSTCLDSMDAFGQTVLFWARKTGNLQLVDLIDRYSGSESVLNNANNQGMGSRLATPNNIAGYCDICTMDIRDDCDHYRCAICNGGDFWICMECYEFGMRCQDKGHEWNFVRGEQ